MKKITLLLCIILILSLMWGCGDNHQIESENADVTVSVGTWKTAQTLTPYFYEEFLPDGYSLEVMPFTNPGDQKTALLAGSLDMTGTTIPLAITAASKGEPVKIVASLCNKCSALVVGKDSGIKKPEDLKGKTIAYVPGTMHHVLLLDILKKAGLDAEKDVTLTRIDFFDMGQALSDGTIDAFLSGEPYPSQAVQDGYGEILSYPYFDDSIGTINAAMLVTEDTIENHPELVQSLVNSHIEATKYMNSHRDDWLNKAAEFGTEKSLLEISTDNIELCWDIDKTYIQCVKSLAEQMMQMGMIDNVPDVEAMFELSFIENYKESHQ